MVRSRRRRIDLAARWGVVVAAAVMLLAGAPAALAAPITLEGAAYQHMKAFMQDYDKAGFAKVVDCGGLRTYRSALAGVTIRVDSTLTPVAQYDPSTKTLTFSKDPRKVKGAGARAMGETVWHEVTHAIEDRHGDIGYFDSEAYAERNVDYMTFVTRNALPWLELLEKQAKKGVSAEKLKVIWDKYLSTMAEAAELPSTALYPPDLGLMKTWFGFRANADEVKALYLSGKALPGKQGANLRRALASSFSVKDWAGAWGTAERGGVLTLTVSGSSVTGVWQNPGWAKEFQGVVSADAGTITGTWLAAGSGSTWATMTFSIQLYHDVSRDQPWYFNGYVEYVDEYHPVPNRVSFGGWRQ
jgi:hypothetical protein